jgi:hypothetical protein
VAQLMNAAETYDDPDLLILGHVVATTAQFSLGDPIKCREHADRVLALYSEARHGHLAGILTRLRALGAVVAIFAWLGGRKQLIWWGQESRISPKSAVVKTYPIPRVGFVRQDSRHHVSAADQTQERRQDARLLEHRR